MEVESKQQLVWGHSEKQDILDQVATNRMYLVNIEASLQEEVCKAQELQQLDKRTSSMQSPTPSPSKPQRGTLAEVDYEVVWVCVSTMDARGLLANNMCQKWVAVQGFDAQFREEGKSFEGFRAKIHLLWILVHCFRWIINCFEEKARWNPIATASSALLY